MHGAEGWIPDVLFGWDAMWVAAVILVVTYAAIISERFNRAILALLGAALMVYAGILNQAAAIKGIDFNTIALLTGMMIVVAITRRCGVFQYLAIWAAKRVKAHPAGILFMLQIITAVASALLDNVTTVLLVIPVTLVIVQEMKLPAWPFLVTQIFAANIGGTATLIGDPPNILIGSQVGIPFNDFLIHLAPIVVVIQIVMCGVFHLLWGRKLKAPAEARARVMAFDEKRSISDFVLMRKSLGVIALIIVAFTLAHALHLEPGTIALSGAAVLMLLDNLGRSAEEQSHHVHQTFGEVEWVTIFFFVGLFVVIYGDLLWRC
jgi:Na+/H+ antiporter NhaD/arsenite permease-like protein